MEEIGYKGYRLVKKASGTHILTSPTGVEIALFVYTMGGFAGVSPITEGLMLEDAQKHKSEEQLIRYVVHQYELLTTTRRDRFINRISLVLSRGPWSAIAAIAATIAAVLSLLNFLQNRPEPISPVDPIPIVEEIAESNPPQESESNDNESDSQNKGVEE